MFLVWVERTTPVPPNKKALLVEDEATARALVERALTAAGWQVSAAVTGDEALRRCKNESFDAVIVDYRLPDTEGLTLVRELRREGLAAAVIALTSDTSQELPAQFMRAGADDFLVKDFYTALRILKTVETAVQIRADRPGLREGTAGSRKQPGPAPESPSLSLLHIDDAPVARAVVKKALAEYGAWTLDLKEASSGQIGLHLAGANAFDIILLDYNLPDMMGTEVVRQLRSKQIDTPVIGLTGSTTDDVAARFLENGAQDFLNKNEFTPTRLGQTIKNVLWLKRLHGMTRSRAARRGMAGTKQTP